MSPHGAAWGEQRSDKGEPNHGQIDGIFGIGAARANLIERLTH